jgi:CubicO group peptidase (beta-lactamase class C family)
MSDGGTEDLDDVIRTEMAALGIPGAAVAVLTGDGTDVRVVCEGVTSVDHPLPITPTTLFQIGSISKTFVATAAMALVADGRLDLDEPVLTYVDDLRLSSDELTEGVTTRHLLTHTTGWVGDYFADTGEGDDALARFVAKLAKAPQLTPLGATYSYNNSAFNLASHVVARVHGTSYEKAVKDLVLRPLDLGQTCFTAEEAITRRTAIGHRDGKAQRWRRPRAHHGAGGVLSCVDDLVAYARFHLAAATEEIAAMQVPQRAAGSLCDEVGLSWMIDHHAGVTLVHHGGTTNGYQADLRLAPERGLAWVMLTNAEHHHQLDRAIRECLLGPDPLEPHAPTADALDEYAGHYESVLADLDVVVDGGALRLDVSLPRRALWNADDAVPPPASTRLVFRDADRVQALDAPYTAHRGEFVRGDDGQVAWFRWDGRLARRMR